jgi:hypothetical protein
MIPAGIRVYLYNATAKLPDEIAISLIRTARTNDESKHGDEVIGEPVDHLSV